MQYLEDFKELKRKIEKLQSSSDMAKGVLIQIKNELKDKFDCSSIKEAKTLLKDIEEKINITRKKIENAIKRFKQEWGNAND